MITIKSTKLPMIALLTALSLIAFLIESLLPPLIIPGAKLGLGNIFIMLCLIWFSLPETLIMLAAKCMLAAVFGGFSQILYSAPAGLIAVLLSFVFVRFLSDKVSLTAVCCMSAVVHNLAQLTVFGLFTQSDVTYYLPLLAVAGVIAGVVTGIATFFIIKYVPFEISRKKE